MNKINQQAYTLNELNKSIQAVLRGNFPGSVWIIAEISDIRASSNGHCYLELIEKEEGSDHLLAKARATIWAYSFRLIKPYFETTTGYELTNGIKVLVNVTVEFHELYGLSLNILDIEPSYTLGDVAKRRIEIIKKLESEGVVNMNKMIPFPLAPRKIAVISSTTAAGYEDFKDQLVNNTRGYKFYFKLFPAVMQGTRAENSIISALEKIHEHEKFFDTVIIIRGGGAKTDLSCFDSYWLAYHVAQFPLPVLTGIGHQRDGSVVDMVAHENLKTPTAVAEFLVNKLHRVDCILEELKHDLATLVHERIKQNNKDIQLYSRHIQQACHKKISKEKITIHNAKGKLVLSGKNHTRRNEQHIYHLANTFKKKVSGMLKDQLSLLDKLHQNIKYTTIKRLTQNKHDILFKQQTIDYLNPENLLRKGYSITYHEGKVVKDSSKLTDSEIIETILFKGKVKSQVKNSDS